MKHCYIYARKSSESEDRQVLSIDSQVSELEQLAVRLGLPVTRVFSESKSAKTPGRPVFTDMLERLRNPEGSVVLCWKLDRLARNPLDGGAVIWAVEERQIGEIVTPGRTFRNTADDKFWMQLEFGMAKKYVDDLSDNIKRGNRAKLQRGQIPGQVPLGYTKDPCTGDTIPDPERFELVRRIWQRLVDGHRPAEILRVASSDWGLRTRGSKRTASGPLSPSYFYRLLSNPFYAGVVQRAGQVYVGAHQAMVSQHEFDLAQRMLAGRSNSRSQRHEHTYAGLLRCGVCGRMFTGESHTNRYGSTYVYYRCTRKRLGSRVCPQPYVPEKVIDEQVLDYLGRLSVPRQFVDWACKRLERLAAEDQATEQVAQSSIEKGLAAAQRKLENLTQLRLSEMIGDEEFVLERARLLDEVAGFKARLAAPSTTGPAWLQPTKEALALASRAENLYRSGLKDDKRTILRAIGSNFFIRDRIVLIQAKKPFRILAAARDSSEPEPPRVEPRDFGSAKQKNEPSSGRFLLWWTLRDSNPWPPPCHGGALAN